MQKCRFYVRLCYDQYQDYKMSYHTFKVTNIIINLIKINSITKTNDSYNENQQKCH